MYQTMEDKQVICKYFFEDLLVNRKKLFEEALKNAKTGKVLYIMCDELDELPQLSQDLSSISRHYMKMISFLYAKTLESLLENLSTLPDWQSIPSTIIIDDISAYCNKSNLHKACALVALLLDATRSCAECLQTPCTLCISATKGIVDEQYCSTLSELYFSI